MTEARGRVIAALMALEADEESDPRLILTEEEGQELEAILAAGAPQWVNDLRASLQQPQGEPRR